MSTLLRRVRPILKTSDIYKHVLADVDALLRGECDE